MHLFIYCLWLLLHYKGRIGYLWQGYSLWSLKYLLSGPLRKKTATLTQECSLLYVPGGSMVFCYDASLVQKFTDISHLKANSFRTPQQRVLVKQQGLRVRTKAALSPPQEWTSWPGLQGWMPVHQGAATFFSSFLSRSRSHQPFCQWPATTGKPLILLIVSQHLWATDSIHCQLYVQRSTCQGAEVGEEIWKMKGSCV